MKKTLAIVLATCLLSPALMTAQDAKPADAPAKSALVPIEILKSKHIAVQIKINDKGPFRVIFDTGAPVTFVSNSLAEKADLLTEKEMQALRGAKDKKGPAGFPNLNARLPRKAKKLEIGDLVIENTEVMIMDHPLLGVASKVLGPLDGIVGFPFFSRYKMTIDYQNETMSFEPSEYKSSGGYLEMMVGVMYDAKPKKKVQAPVTLWGFSVVGVKDDDSGILVNLVLPGTPASAAGLKTGDRLLVLDGTWTDTVEDCYRAATGAVAGQKVVARVQRDGKDVELVIVPKLGL